MPDLPSGLKQVFPVTAQIAKDHVVIGGCDTVALAEQFGTPLFVFCEQTFRDRARQFRRAFPAAQIYYAAKAFLCVPLCRLLEQEGLGLDVASGGELHTALAARFPPERMIFHGNNKQDDDIVRSVHAGIGRIAIDNLEEIERVARAAESVGRLQPVILRLTPGVEAHTHEYIQTGQQDSKFGISVRGGAASAAVKRVLEQPSLQLVGVHAHIGSNIFSAEPFGKTIEILLGLAAELESRQAFRLNELNLGGGFGIPQLPTDRPAELEAIASHITQTVDREAGRYGLEAPRLCFEPGRFLVGNAMVTLYRVGVIKRIEGLRTYVSIDGGMSDNIRPALYGAKYVALLANKAAAETGTATQPVSLAGVHCETGDVLIKDLPLPSSVVRGDLVVVPATGAYNYSMASNYNRQPRPAVVAVQHGSARVLIRRETYDDLLRLEEPGD